MKINKLLLVATIVFLLWTGAVATFSYLSGQRSSDCQEVSSTQTTRVVREVVRDTIWQVVEKRVEIPVPTAKVVRVPAPYPVTIPGDTILVAKGDTITANRYEKIIDDGTLSGTMTATSTGDLLEWSLDYRLRVPTIKTTIIDSIVVERETVVREKTRTRPLSVSFGVAVAQTGNSGIPTIGSLGPTFALRSGALSVGYRPSVRVYPSVSNTVQHAAIVNYKLW